LKLIQNRVETTLHGVDTLAKEPDIAGSFERIDVVLLFCQKISLQMNVTRARAVPAKEIRPE
jgi:hypothetical protein